MTFNRYKYHHKVLTSLADRHKHFYDPNKDHKDTTEAYYTINEISTEFKIPKEKSLEILTDLQIDKSVKYLKSNRFIILDDGIKNANSNKYQHISSKSNSDLIIKSIKDFIVIIVGFITIVTFFITTKTEYKETNKKLETLQSQVDSIKSELNNQQPTQGNVLKDSLFYSKR